MEINRLNANAAKLESTSGQAADAVRTIECETAELRKRLETAGCELKRLKSESHTDLVRMNRQQEEIEKLRENEEQLGCQLKVEIQQQKLKVSNVKDSSNRRKCPSGTRKG